MQDKTSNNIIEFHSHCEINFTTIPNFSLEFHSANNIEYSKFSAISAS